MRFIEELDAKRYALRQRKEEMVACIQENTHKTSLPKLESIKDSISLRAYIKILEDCESGVMSKERDVMLDERTSLARVNIIIASESAQRARAKMKEIYELLSI
jgi:hypothetical protein